MREAANRMAMFCVATRMTPSEYKKLTVMEFEAFIEQLNSRSPDIQELF